MDPHELALECLKMAVAVGLSTGADHIPIAREMFAFVINPAKADEPA